MIELLTANTPNGKKISIMLEEINFEYKVTKVNINKDEQFKPDFIKKFLTIFKILYWYFKISLWLFTFL